MITLGVYMALGKSQDVTTKATAPRVPMNVVKHKHWPLVDTKLFMVTVDCIFITSFI